MGKLSARTEATTVADNDLLHLVDTSDTTDGVDGTSKKIQASNFKAITADLDLNGYNLTNVDDASVASLTIGGVLASVTAFSGTNVAKTYATVAAMVAASDLAVGNTAITQGYTSAGDGGAACIQDCCGGNWRPMMAGSITT